MRLKAAVLEVVRGAAGATLLVAVGCAGSESIAREPAPPVAPAPPFVASPPLAVEAPAGKPSVVPSVVMAPLANPSPLAPPVPRLNVDGMLVQGDAVAPVLHPHPQPTLPGDRPARRRPRPHRDRPIEPLAQPMHLPPDIAVACGRG
jgi:hypothetical protein